VAYKDAFGFMPVPLFYISRQSRKSLAFIANIWERLKLAGDMAWATWWALLFLAQLVARFGKTGEKKSTI
jgi:hypothetical protein